MRVLFWVLTVLLLVVSVLIVDCGPEIAKAILIGSLVYNTVTYWLHSCGNAQIRHF